MMATKLIILTRDETILMHAMVRVTEVKQTHRHRLHAHVAERLSRARYHMKGPAVMVSFSIEERQLLRDYNTTYCANLADALLEAESNSDVPVTTCEALYVYRMATRIHHLLS